MIALCVPWGIIRPLFTVYTFGRDSEVEVRFTMEMIKMKTRGWTEFSADLIRLSVI